MSRDSEPPQDTEQSAGEHSVNPSSSGRALQPSLSGASGTNNYGAPVSSAARRCIDDRKRMYTDLIYSADISKCTDGADRKNWRVPADAPTLSNQILSLQEVVEKLNGENQVTLTEAAGSELFLICKESVGDASEARGIYKGPWHDSESGMFQAVSEFTVKGEQCALDAVGVLPDGRDFWATGNAGTGLKVRAAGEKLEDVETLTAEEVSVRRSMADVEI